MQSAVHELWLMAEGRLTFGCYDAAIFRAVPSDSRPVSHFRCQTCPAPAQGAWLFGNRDQGLTLGSPFGSKGGSCDRDGAVGRTTLWGSRATCAADASFMHTRISILHAKKQNFSMSHIRLDGLSSAKQSFSRCLLSWFPPPCQWGRGGGERTEDRPAANSGKVEVLPVMYRSSQMLSRSGDTKGSLFLCDMQFFIQMQQR